MKEELHKILKDYKDYVDKTNKKLYEQADQVEEYPPEDSLLDFTLKGFLDWLEL